MHLMVKSLPSRGPIVLALIVAEPHEDIDELAEKNRRT